MVPCTRAGWPKVKGGAGDGGLFNRVPVRATRSGGDVVGVTSEVYEDTTFSLMCRFTVDGVNATQADCTSIVMKAIQESDNSELLSASLTVANVVFDTLQTDGRWSKDSSGYNFRYDVASSVCQTGERWVQFEATVTTSGGDIIIAGDDWRVWVKEKPGT